MNQPTTALRVALRVDASAAIGTGHLRRCLALAEALRTQGAELVFVVRRLDTVAAHTLQGSGWPVHWLPAPAAAAGPMATTGDDPPHAAWAGVAWQLDAEQTAAALAAQPPQWLVVDHYAFDAHWHEHLRQVLGCRLLVIDDVADRPLSPDLLLDHNWAPDHRAKYRGCLRQEPVAWLTGPRFALLSAAYRHAPRYVFHPQVRSIGVFMGGTDHGGASAQVLQCIRDDVGFTGPVEVVSTSANPNLPTLREACAATPGTTLTLDLPDLAAFFARHDLQIGAGGGATWERCCIGAPAVALALASNQSAVIPGLQSLGVLRALRLDDGARAAGTESLSECVRSLLYAPDERSRLVAAAASMVDGRGCERVGLSLTGPTLQARASTMADARLMHDWRNHPAVRALSFTSGVIGFERHLAWLQQSLQRPDRWLFIGSVGALPVGVIRFDRVDGASVEVSLYLDPELRAAGLGRRLLAAGEAALSSQLDHDTTVRAKVISGNEVSSRMFAASGYVWRGDAFEKPLEIANTSAR